MKCKYILLTLIIAMSGCGTAFEIGEGLNQLTTKTAADPKYLWNIAEPASAPVSTVTSEADTGSPEVAK